MALTLTKGDLAGALDEVQALTSHDVGSKLMMVILT